MSGLGVPSGAWHAVNSGYAPEAKERVDAYIHALCAWDKVHNLTAMSGSAAIVENLVVPSIGIADKLSGHTSLIDLGSGAGIPGLVAAMMFDKQQWLLVERVKKKTVFLKRMVHQLALKNVRILADDFRGITIDTTVDGIVSRGSAKLLDQIELTRAWRASGVPLYSIQTEKSLDESGVRAQCLRQEISGVFSGPGLVLVKVL